VLILLVHLYDYVDVPLAGLTVGGLLDILVSVIAVGLLGVCHLPRCPVDGNN
jgi:hypothetical protein